VRTIYPCGSSKETTNDIFVENLQYVIEGYSVDFAELILEYMTKVRNMAQNFPLSYSNLLRHIFKYFYISLEAEEHLGTRIPTINENTLKSLKFKSLPTGYWKYED